MPPKEDDLIDRVLTCHKVKPLDFPLEMFPVISFVVDKAKAKGDLCKHRLDRDGVGAIDYCIQDP